LRLHSFDVLCVGYINDETFARIADLHVVSVLYVVKYAICGHVVCDARLQGYQLHIMLCRAFVQRPTPTTLTTFQKFSQEDGCSAPLRACENCNQNIVISLVHIGTLCEAIGDAMSAKGRRQPHANQTFMIVPTTSTPLVP
jgi:hypothetical protein